MTTSNSYNWTLSNADCVLEAFSRCQIRGPEITRSHMSEATRSLNLVLQSEFATRGVNLWQVEEGVVIDLVAPVGQVGTATYVLPSYVLQVLNVRYNMPQQNVPGATIDLLKGRGHSPQWSDPDVVVAAIVSVADRMGLKAAAPQPMAAQ